MQKKFDFITNELIVKNNPSLKRRDQFIVEMEVERLLLPDVIGLEAYRSGTHFKVTIEAVEEKTEVVNPITGELQ